MVWVWPPHTSMNLNSSSPASAVICATSALAAVGSRYSSTKRMLDRLCHSAARLGVRIGARRAIPAMTSLPRLQQVAARWTTPPAIRSLTSSDVLMVFHASSNSGHASGPARLPSA